MRLTKCDSCKKIIEGDIYGLVMSKASSIFEFGGECRFDICESCYRNLCKKLRNTEENKDGNTES